MRPFLENVTRGRNIPPERLDDVAEHYLHFGGVSPINGINRALIEQLRVELDRRGRPLPVYFGNRNWEPYVEDTVTPRCATTVSVGPRCSPRRRGAATRAARSTSRTSPVAARRRATRAPELVKLRQYFDHPLFVEMFADGIACRRGDAARRARAPTRGWCSPRTRFRWPPTSATARSSTAGRSPTRRGWSRRPPGTTTTTRCGSRGPDRRAYRGWNPMSANIFRPSPTAGTQAVIVCPIGFVADHIEVVWDLDNELDGAGRGRRDRRGPCGHAQRRPALRAAGRGAGRRTPGRRCRRARRRVDRAGCRVCPATGSA